MEYLLLLCAFPLIWPFIAKKIWPHEISWAELAINVVGVMIIVSGVWFAGKYGATSDIEVWNGQIVSKQIHDGYYVESYQCRCRQQCSGSGSKRSCHTVCDTCYRNHYTREWLAVGDFGKKIPITLDYLDTTSKRKRNNAGEPAIYRNCQPGEPASIENTYTNYVQAVPDSLFNNEMDSTSFEGKIPEYPRVYGKYRINRVLNVDSSIPSHLLTGLNEQLNERLIKLGPKKQANVVVIVTEIDDPSYKFAVENAWVGGKKNDIVVFVGVDGTNITWADTMTFALNSGNELFQVTLRDKLNTIGDFDYMRIADAIDETTGDLFDRISMEEFKYLESQIQPANWVIGIAVFLSIFGTLGVSLLMRYVEIG